MVFLRPTIVRSKEDIHGLSQKSYDALRSLSQPEAKANNTLLLPRDPQQLFDGNLSTPAQP